MSKKIAFDRIIFDNLYDLIVERNHWIERLHYEPSYSMEWDCGHEKTCKKILARYNKKIQFYIGEKAMLEGFQSKEEEIIEYWSDYGY